MELVISSFDCRKILQKFDLKYNKGEIKNFSLSPFSEKCTGFLAIHKFLTIETTCGDRVRFFVKLKPEKDDHMNYVNEIKAFEKECKSYEILIPALREISKKNGAVWAPECYLTRSNLIVLKFMTDFVLSKTGHLLNFEHVNCALQSLAYFHSSSIIFEHNGKSKTNVYRINEIFPECCIESTYNDDRSNVRWSWFHKGVGIVLSMARIMRKYNEKQLEIIERKLPQMLSRIRGRFKPSTKYTNVFCHGDLWSNNLMFKYVEDKPIECCLVDFQLGRYAPYVTDLISLISLNTDKVTRKENLDHFLQVYRQTFNRHLINAGISGENLIDKMKLSADYEEFRESVSLETCLYEMITGLDCNIGAQLIGSEENFREFFYGDRSKFVLPMFNKEGPFRERMMEVVQEFVEDFILNTI